jgi:hypothetical protein
MQHLSLKFTDYSAWIEVQVTGAYDFEDAREFIRILPRESQARGCKRVLIDLLLMEDDIPDWERFLLGKETAEIIGASIQLAVAAPAEKINHFWENTAVNRGANVAIFPSKEEALNWLIRALAARGTPPLPQGPDAL